MKKFLVGLPIVFIGLLLFVLPGLVFGEIGMLILIITLLIGVLGCLAYTIGEEILEKIERRK